MKIDISKLREETLKAIQKGEELKRQKQIEDSQKEKLREDQARAWAELQMLNVPQLAMKAAQKGKNKITVADTRNHYSATKTHNNKFIHWETTGIGLKYFYLEELLYEAGFEVEVTFQHDGVGISSWYNIDAKW